MNKATFINLAKDLALAAFITALIYSFICMMAVKWIDIFSDSPVAVISRIFLVPTFYGIVIGRFAERKFRS